MVEVMPLPRDWGAVQRGSCVPLVLGREVVDIDTGETFVAVGITVDAEGLLAAVST